MLTRVLQDWAVGVLKVTGVVSPLADTLLPRLSRFREGQGIGSALVDPLPSTQDLLEAPSGRSRTQVSER